MSSEDGIVEYLKRIDRVMEKKNYAEPTTDKSEGVRLEGRSKFREIIKRKWNSMELSLHPTKQRRIKREKCEKSSFMEHT